MYEVRAIAAATTFAAATSIAPASAGMIEQDVYVEPGSGQIWRINADEADAFGDTVVVAQR